MFKKRNALSKYWLKYTDKKAYKLYKWEVQNYNAREVTNFYTGQDILDSAEKILAKATEDKQLNVLHSGNAGDVIYALPTIKRMHELAKVPVNLYLRLDQPMVMSGGATHPLGNVMLNKKMADMLSPLIAAQDYINVCEPYADQKVHVNLDIVRSKTISLSNGNIARWYSYFTGITPELWKSWLTVTPNKQYASSIILARSERYRNASIDYSFLKLYSDLYFIGVQSEFDDMRKAIPDLKHLQVGNFLELASVIAGCKLFIGNQSFPFSVAEGLKVPRILEVFAQVANVIPEGPGAHDFYFQTHFEELVRDIYAS